jgi:hypothetical protein
VLGGEASTFRRLDIGARQLAAPSIVRPKLIERFPAAGQNHHARAGRHTSTAGHRDGGDDEKKRASAHDGSRGNLLDIHHA